MQKKRPMLRRAWDFIAVTAITPLGKVARRRIAVCCGGGRGGGRKLVLFKRARTRLGLLRRHYNYRFIGEYYEFSPESTPLFPPRGRWPGAPEKKSRLLRLLMCGGGSGVEANGGSRYKSSIEAIGWQGDEWEIMTTTDGNVEASAEGGKEPPEAPTSEWSAGEEDEYSVDRRAEMFIERFYDEMRIQRQDSEVKYAEMLARSC